MKKKCIGLLGFNGVSGLDLMGPWDAFSNTFLPNTVNTRAYETVLVGLTRRPFRTETGMRLVPTTTIHAETSFDTIVIPGGGGLRTHAITKPVVEWIRRVSPRTRRIVSVCTGIYGVAPTGLLDGRNVTTHWRFSRDVSQTFPKLKVGADAIYVKDGAFYTSAGVTAGIDLALALIEEDFGTPVSLSVARELVVYMKRPGGQEQYSEPLHFQSHAIDRFGDLAAWIAAHLNADLSVEALAARACLCSRHFSREFKAVFHSSPARFVETLRLDASRDRLITKKQSIDQISRSLGFTSEDSFRRAFERRFGIPPSEYRHRFQSQP